MNLVAHSHYERIPEYRDLTPRQEWDLLQKGLNRVTDTCIPEEEAFRRLQKHIFEERKKLDAQTSKLQKELASIVPPLKGRERVHEGVILGTYSNSHEASMMEQNGTSSLAGKSYDKMNRDAEQARKEGKYLGGAMVVSFGTPEKMKMNPFNPLIEEKRAVWDSVTAGQFSLATPQGQEAVKRLAGKEFDRLIAHSNGASVAEALIRNDVIKVNELNIVGGDRSLLNEPAFQQLMDSGKVKRVVVWVHKDDPVPGFTSLMNEKLNPILRMELAGDNAKHLLNKTIIGNLAAGDACIEYRECYNKPEAPAVSFAAHRLETSYNPCIAKGTWRTIRSCK